MAGTEIKAAKEEKTFTGALSSLILKNRIVLISIILVLIIAAAAMGVINTISISSHKKAYSQIDEATVLLADAEKNLTDNELTAKKDEIKAQILALAEKNSKNSVGARAFMFVAEMDYADKNFEKAADSWIKAIGADKKSYTSAICYYNAAACYEELDNIEEAMSCYENAINSDNFPLKAHAIFNLGRLAESSSNFEKAKQWYQKLQDDFSGDSWASLGMSRLIALKADGIIQ